jgi:hypothetical protein
MAPLPTINFPPFLESAERKHPGQDKRSQAGSPNTHWIPTPGAEVLTSARNLPSQIADFISWILRFAICNPAGHVFATEALRLTHNSEFFCGIRVQRPNTGTADHAAPTPLARSLENIRVTGHLHPLCLSTSLPVRSQRFRRFVLTCAGSLFANSARHRKGQIVRSVQNKFNAELSMNVPLGIVEPTDSGILADLFKEVIRDGEKRLMLAVLESATEDFQKYALATDRRGRELFQAAEEWILETDNPSFFSFQNICEHLQLDPDYMRQGFMRWKAERLAGRSKQCFKSAARRAS